MGIQDIGDNVRRHMKIRGLTIPQLSAKMGMGTAALSNLLNGKAEPKSSTLIKLAEGLDVPFDELLADAPKLKSLRFRTAKTLSGREKAERDQLRHDSAIWLSDYSFLEKELKVAPAYRLAHIPSKEPRAAAMAVRSVFKLEREAPIYDISELMEQAGIKHVFAHSASRRPSVYRSGLRMEAPALWSIPRRAYLSSANYSPSRMSLGT